MNRLILTTHLGVALLALGVLVLTSFTLGVAGSFADRTTAANVVEDNAYADVNFQGEGIENKNFAYSRNETFNIFNLSNNFNNNLNGIEPELKKTFPVRNEDQTTVTFVNPNRGIDNGNSQTYRAECNEDSYARYKLIISANIEYGGSVEIIREDIEIECTQDDGQLTEFS